MSYRIVNCYKCFKPSISTAVFKTKCKHCGCNINISKDNVVVSDGLGQIQALEQLNKMKKMLESKAA
jgi:hypothetical protein